MPSVWQALRRGESASERRAQLARAYERLAGRFDELAGDAQGLRELADAAGLRPVVFESWLRARDSTLDPERVPGGVPLADDELEDLQTRHPMTRVLPVVNRLLVDQAAEAGFVVAIGDAAGRLLWVDGDRRLRARAEDMGFRAGTDWSEGAVGTSAPGSALALGHGIQVLGAEHYNRFVHQWSCTAVPVRDPLSGSLIGVLDVTGGDEAALPHVMPMLEATIAAVEAELKLETLSRQLAEAKASAASPRHPSAVGPARRQTGRSTVPPTAGADPAQSDGRRASRRPRPSRLLVLGRDPAVLEFAGGAIDLPGRHAEILLALSAHPQGLTAAELSQRVYGDRGAAQTLRAEVVRLRGRLTAAGAPLSLGSRPYRLSGPLAVDAADALGALARGAHRLALASYEGPVLPGSDAPAADELRREVDATLREAMLTDAAAEPLYDYAERWARDDREAWETLLRVLPPRSPKRARVVARLAGG